MRPSRTRSAAGRLASRAVVALLAASLALGNSAAFVAQAAPPAQGLTNVVPFLGVFVGWSHRNKIYREANNFIADRNEYYDALRDTARRQLANREIAALRPSQVAAYTKLVAMIEQNRQGEIAVAEARKREARSAFNRRLEGVIIQRVLGTGAIQRVFGAMRKGINNSQDFLDTAIDNVSGDAGGVLAQVERVRTVARDVETVAGFIGGPTGAGLRRAAGRIASAIERPQEMIRSDLEKVRGDVGDLGGTVDTLAAAGRTPSAGALAKGLILRTPEGSDDPAVQAVSILVSKLSVGDGSLQDRAKAAIQAGFVARCTAIADAYRQALARLDGSAELSAAQATAPCNAINPDQLVQQAQQTEAVSSGTPTGGGTPVPASIEIVSHDTSQANCGTSTVNSWTYCDVTITFNVAFETPTLPASVVCKNFTSEQTVPLEVRKGTLSFTITNETKNVSVLGPEGWAMCEVVIDGVPVASDSLE
jgi:hypothetical protein